MNKQKSMNIMKFIQHVLLFILLSVSLVVCGQPAGYSSLPYFCGFENPEDTMGTYGWKFEKRAKVGHTFAIGNAVAFDNFVRLESYTSTLFKSESPLPPITNT